MPKAPLPTSVGAIYVGIDPGKSGGVSVLVPRSQFPTGIGDLKADLNMFKMPVTEMDMLDMFRSFKSLRTIEYRAYVELVGGYAGEGQPGSAMFNFGFITGAARTACLAAGIPLEVVAPATWQKALSIPSRKKTESKTQWKNRLKGVAQRLFPAENIILQVADSVLIAEYCRRKVNGLIK